MSKYNWIPDTYSLTDVYVQDHPSFTLAAPSAVPSKVDLTKYCSPVFNQGQIGSCTGNALVAAIEYLENKDKDFEKDGKFIHLSRLFVYYDERMVEGTINVDGGAMIADGIKTLSQYGVCTEELWPYRENHFKDNPSDAAYTDAQTRKITAYARVNQDINSIKTTLASGYPIVFGFSVYDYFESESMAEFGDLSMPKSNEKLIGGHAVLAVGYDDSKQRVTVRNSWGEDWGQDGYFTMPYQYISDASLARDFWTITK